MHDPSRPAGMVWVRNSFTVTTFDGSRLSRIRVKTFRITSPIGVLASGKRYVSLPHDRIPSVVSSKTKSVQLNTFLNISSSVTSLSLSAWLHSSFNSATLTSAFKLVTSSKILRTLPRQLATRLRAKSCFVAADVPGSSSSVAGSVRSRSFAFASVAVQTSNEYYNAIGLGMCYRQHDVVYLPFCINSSNAVSMSFT